MKKRVFSASHGYRATLSEEDGQLYHGYHQNLDPVISHVKKIRDMHSQSTRSSNPNEWRHVGSVPIVVITDWLKANGYRFDQFARNEDRCREKFMRHFLSRDFSKLHNQHVTTRRESSQIVVPKSISRDAVDLSGIGA